MDQKKRLVVAFENMSEELAAAFNEKYPRGVIDYLPDVKKIDKPDGTSIYTVTVEIPSAIYLVKVKVKIDDIDEVNKYLDEDDDNQDEEGEEAEDDATLPDDNISQYSTGDDDTPDAE